jgi:hypothetical protein
LFGGLFGCLFVFRADKKVFSLSDVEHSEKFPFRLFNKMSKMIAESLGSSSATNNWKFLVALDSLRLTSSGMKIFVAARDRITQACVGG